MTKVKTKAHLTKETLDRNDKTREKFLEVYFNNYCHADKSCSQFGIHRATYYEWRKKHPEFRRKCDDVKDQMRCLVDDATIKLLYEGHAETVKDVRKILKGTDKFPTGRFVKYSLKNLNTLDDIKATRLRAISDFGDGLLDQDAVETINKLLDSLVNNIVANEGFKDLQEALILQKKIRENG
jgi:hypothetical protein